MVALNFDCPVGHFVYGLVDYNSGAWLAHNFIYLIAFRSNQQRDHALRDKDDDRKTLSPYFLEDVVDIFKKSLAGLVFFLHFFIINLNHWYIYLNVTTIQIGYI